MTDKQRTDDIIQVDSLNAESKFGGKRSFLGGKPYIPTLLSICTPLAWVAAAVGGR